MQITPVDGEWLELADGDGLALCEGDGLGLCDGDWLRLFDGDGLFEFVGDGSAELAEGDEPDGEGLAEREVDVRAELDGEGLADRDAAAVPAPDDRADWPKLTADWLAARARFDLVSGTAPMTAAVPFPQGDRAALPVLAKAAPAVKAEHKKNPTAT